MKKSRLVISIGISIFFLITFFSACKRINEATELGGGILPTIDNINTFDSTLPVQSFNKRMLDDTSKLIGGDDFATGILNDPVFGSTNAVGYFNVSSTTYGNYPFFDNTRNSIVIDSVVLSLAYTGGYGDSTLPMTVNVKEIAPTETIYDTAFYGFHENRLATNSVLGSKTFTLQSLRDSFKLIRLKDTQSVANVVRIPLNNSLGYRFANFDSLLTSANPGFYNDSAFKKLFKGFAIETSNAGGVGTLAYFNVFDQSKTKMTIYFSALHNGVRDTSSINFVHNLYAGVYPGGVANSIQRTPGGEWATALSGTSTDKVYIQTEPNGSYTYIKIPGLDQFPNKIVHRAELIVTKLSSVAEDRLYPPSQIFLDHKNAKGDSTFTFMSDLQSGTTYNFTSFGGNLYTDNTYRFNITRYVQSILTKHVNNDTLRLYAPFTTNSYILDPAGSGKLVRSNITITDKIARGRIVVAGGSYADPQVRMRLRLVYSNL